MVAYPGDTEESLWRMGIDLYYCMLGSMQCQTHSTEPSVTSVVLTNPFDSSGCSLVNLKMY